MKKEISDFLNEKMSNEREMKKIRNEFHRNGYYCFKDFSFFT